APPCSIVRRQSVSIRRDSVIADPLCWVALMRTPWPTSIGGCESKITRLIRGQGWTRRRLLVTPMEMVASGCRGAEERVDNGDARGVVVGASRRADEADENRFTLFEGDVRRWRLP